MSQQPIIALDAMGGDSGPAVVVPAALSALRQHPGLRLLLVGQERAITKQLALANAEGLLGDNANAPLQLVHAEQTISMEESPSRVLRAKPDSSMHQAITLLAEGKADACVSAGNTGALMAVSKHLLQTIRGIERPAIISELPGPKRSSLLLDLGANVGCSGEHLVQFAIMGAVLAEVVHGIVAPRVALLNVGKEAIKGTEQVKLAAQTLAKIKGINFIGYVEGNEIFQGIADVVVCDGFVGNVALKAAEGVMDLVLDRAARLAASSLVDRLLWWAMRPLASKLQRQLDPREHNGAALIGLKRTVIKSHGGADSNAFATAIARACKQASQQVPEKIETQVSLLLEGHQ